MSAWPLTKSSDLQGYRGKGRRQVEMALWLFEQPKMSPHFTYGGAMIASERQAVSGVCCEGLTEQPDG